MKRFYAKIIPYKNKLFFRCIPDCKSEYAIQFLEKIQAEFFIAMDKDFCVRGCTEAMAFFLQFIS